MRTIKFRAWNRECERMYYPEEVKDHGGWYQDLVAWDKDGEMALCEDLSHAIYADYLTLMQFTGLKDKDGKEIYEGDVVNDAGLECIIEWNNYRWVNRLIGNDKDDVSVLTDIDKFGIIGNIYENPELLKGKQQ